MLILKLITLNSINFLHKCNINYMWDYAIIFQVLCFQLNYYFKKMNINKYLKFTKREPDLLLINHLFYLMMYN